MKHIFTVDVEDWYHGFSPSYNVPFPHIGRLEYGMNNLLDLLEKNEVKATFFWLASQAARYPDLLRKTAAQGHEIGCHGLAHIPITMQTPGEFKATTSHAIFLLEDLLGEPIQSFRAPFFSINSGSLWALDILVSLGIRYDSSILPMRHWRTGVANADDSIHNISTPSGEITEVPVTMHRYWWGSIPVAGGGYFRAYPFALIDKHFSQSGKPAVFYIHPWEIDEHHPRIGKGLLKPMHYLNIHSTKDKLEKLLKVHRFGPMMESITQSSSNLIEVYD